MTFAPVVEFPNYVSSTPTSCQIEAPVAVLSTLLS